MTETSSIVLWLVLLAAIGMTGWRTYQRARPLLTAPSVQRFNHPGQRLMGVLRAVGLHERLLQRPYAGILHGLIFISFFVLATSIVEAFGSGLFPGFTLAGIGGETWIGLLQDIFAILMLTGIGLAVWQRFVIRPARFVGSNRRDATIIYLLIAAIVSSMLLQAAFAIAGGMDGAWRPVATAIASLLMMLDISLTGLHTGEQAFYWLHIVAILTFLIYIPGSKHRHMFLAAPNIYLRNLQPKGQAPDVPAERETAGINAIDQFDWKQKLDLLSCTECGRCQAACPAYAAGLPLSPKLLITDLRDHMTAPRLADMPALIGGVIREETLWACTTCRACMEVCPIHIEHLPKIIDMRRQMIDDGKVQPMLQEALSNLQRSGNSMGKAGRMRARWTKDLPFKIKDARQEAVDILWFVGDYASYDPRVQDITRKVAILLNAAGVDFGLLFDGEQNSGNDVRRVGEEGLFETLARSNIEAIESCSFNRIMTTDPHSLNALRNEYLAYGKAFPVLHHTELLAELIQAGRLQIERQAEQAVTYHDPCYLGRYNGGFDAPRDLIRAAGFRLHDMPRCRENSFCCGAGGGRIWSDDTGVTERPSENRIKEALSLGDASIFVVACPKDKVMYSAAIQALGVESRLTVLDIAEFLHPKIPNIPAQPTSDRKLHVPA